MLYSARPPQEVIYSEVNGESVTDCPFKDTRYVESNVVVTRKVGTSSCAKCKFYNGSGGFLENGYRYTTKSVKCDHAR